jgi:hypothetical protein
MTLNEANARARLTTTAADVYQCPAAAKAIALSVVAANVSELEATVTVQWYDSSSGATTYLLYQAPIPKRNSVDLPKFVLEAGDKLQALCGTAGAIDITASILEVS